MSSGKPPLPTDLLMPQGHPLGTQGTGPSIRILPGGKQAAEELFADLAAGGMPVAVPRYIGTMIDLQGGGRVGLRITSKSGDPTIDVDIPGVPIKKIKFV